MLQLGQMHFVTLYPGPKTGIEAKDIPADLERKGSEHLIWTDLKVDDILVIQFVYTE